MLGGWGLPDGLWLARWTDLCCGIGGDDIPVVQIAKEVLVCTDIEGDGPGFPTFGGELCQPYLDVGSARVRVHCKKIAYDLGIVPDGMGGHALGDQVLQPGLDVRLVI